MREKKVLFKYEYTCACTKQNKKSYAKYEELVNEHMIYNKDK